MSERILLMDDDDLIRTVVSERLKRRGFEVTTAKSLTEARDALKSAHPDAALLDIRLPDLSGLEVCSHFQAYRIENNTPILAISSYGAELDLDDLMNRGADGFLPKPLKILELKKQIRKLVG